MALACLMLKHSLANGRNGYMKTRKPQAQEFAFCWNIEILVLKIAA